MWMCAYVCLCVYVCVCVCVCGGGGGGGGGVTRGGGGLEQSHSFIGTDQLIMFPYIFV